MLPLQIMLHPERNENAWPSPPRAHARKRRNSGSFLARRPSNPRLRASLPLCSAQHSHRSPPTPKTSRRRSRHLSVRHSSWLTVHGSTLVDLIHYCSTVVEAAVSRTLGIAHTVFDAASAMLQNWWSGNQGDDSTMLEIVERQPNEHFHEVDNILKENNRLKRMLEFAMTSHVIMNEATCMLEDGADLWMKRAEEIVEAKMLKAEQERDALAIQLEELQEQVGDKEQEIERLRDGFVWVTDSLNAKEDEICELHERLERYEALLKVLNAEKVV